MFRGQDEEIYNPKLGDYYHPYQRSYSYLRDYISEKFHLAYKQPLPFFKKVQYLDPETQNKIKLLSDNGENRCFLCHMKVYS